MVLIASAQSEQAKTIALPLRVCSACVGEGVNFLANNSSQLWRENPRCSMSLHNPVTGALPAREGFDVQEACALAAVVPLCSVAAKGNSEFLQCQT
jgi:hypothetical protein